MASWNSLRTWIIGFAKNHSGPYLPNLEAKELLFPHAADGKVVNPADIFTHGEIVAPVEPVPEAPDFLSGGQPPNYGPSQDPLLRGDEPAPMEEDLPSNPIAVGAGHPLGEGSSEAPSPQLALARLRSKLDQVSSCMLTIQSSVESLSSNLPSLVRAEVSKVAPPSPARTMPPPGCRLELRKPLEAVRELLPINR